MIERFSLSYIVQGLGIDLVEVVSLTDIAVRVSSGGCLLYTSPSPRDATLSRMPSSA